MKKPLIFAVVSILGILFFMISWKTARHSSAAPSAVTVFSATDRDPYTESLAGNVLPEKVELFYFYEQSCEVCDELDDFWTILSKELPGEIRGANPHSIYTINIFSGEGEKTYRRVTDAMGLDRGVLQPPLLIAGGRVFQGNDTIASNIKEAYLTSAEDIFIRKSFYNPALKKTGLRLFEEYSLDPSRITMVYFYRTVCPYCERVKPLIDGLPKKINRGGVQAGLDIIRINTRSGNNNERIAVFFENYQVPDEDRRVPIVFFSDGYLSGVEAISGDLNKRLSAPPSGTDKLAGLFR